MVSALLTGGKHENLCNKAAAVFSASAFKIQRMKHPAATRRMYSFFHGNFPIIHLISCTNCASRRMNMEITFENNTTNIRREIYHQTKRTQESTESVVPDTDDDIGRILSVQSSVMLKSKDVTSRGVSISGEAIIFRKYVQTHEKILHRKIFSKVNLSSNIA